MTDADTLIMSLPTGIATGVVASTGFFLWLRFRRNIIPKWNEMASQFAFSTAAGCFVAYQSLSNKIRSRDALSRMVHLTEGEHILATSNESAIPIQTYEDSSTEN